MSELVAKPVQLNCGHIMHYYPVPRIGDVVHCNKCIEYRRVVGGNVNVEKLYKIKCEDCKYTRNYNGELGPIKTKAQTHAIANHHLVHVLDRQKRNRAIYDHRPNAESD